MWMLLSLLLSAAPAALTALYLLCESGRTALTTVGELVQLPRERGDHVQRGASTRTPVDGRLRGSWQPITRGHRNSNDRGYFQR